MYAYKIYGIVIESEFEIKVLLPAEGGYDRQDVITVRERDVEDEVMRILTEADALSCSYEIGMSVSAFANQGGFFLIRGGNEISIKISKEFNRDTVSPWILGFALSMAMLQRNILTIHCSAVVTNEGAVLISGTPGAGKSSLARKLIEDGYGLMADDVAAVRLCGDDCMIYPAFPYQKLCSNEVKSRNLNIDDLVYINEDKDKYLVPVKEIFVDSPTRLSCFFYIIKAPVKELSVRRLTGFECFITIKDNLFLHRLKGSWETAPEVIGSCMNIASKCPIYLIIRPDGADTLDEIKSEVEKAVRNC